MDDAEIATPRGEEMAALRQGAGWGVLAADRLDLTGADRVRFLHNLITCEVRELPPGSTRRGFLTHVKGGVLADAEVVALADRLRLVLPAGRGPAIQAHLEKYRIAEQVEITARPDLAALVVRGARAPEALTALGLPAPAPEGRREGVLAGAAVAVRRDRRGREPRFDLEHAAVDLVAVVGALGEAAERLGIVEVSPAALDCVRIEDGELAWGIDYGEENFPQETGEESAVSYDKGCYLGQEVVARIHYRGGVQRSARGLRFAGAPPAPGTAVLAGGREAGRVTSTALSPRCGPIGLAIVHRRAGEPPAEVELVAGGVATLADLPFPASSDETTAP